MTKSKFLSWGGMLFALCAMLAVTSCSESEDAAIDEQIPEPEIVNGMANAAFTGIVTYGGTNLRGVSVTSGDQTVKTDINGVYTLNKVSVVNGRAVVKFQKTGFMSVVRSLPFQKETRLDVAMKECEEQAFSAASGATLNLYAGLGSPMVVTLPANGFVTESGAEYSGTVNAASVYLDPDDALFINQMPGDLSAVRTDESEAQLISYGMVAVELTDGSGKKLQLAPGQKATVKFPIPDKFNSGTRPSSIPLWSFDEATGLWVEEGTATLSGDLYVGEVSHFSWHNLDYPERRATLKVKVVDNNGGAIAGVLVDFDGQRSGYTNNEGVATCVVPSNTDMVITIPSTSYGDYANVWNSEYNYYEYDATKIVKQNVTLAPQEEKTITMQMPVRIPVISGKITNEGTGSQVCIVWVTYPGGETVRTITDLQGNYSLLAPANYRGEATLYAQYGDAYKVKKKFTITDSDQVVNLTANSNAPAGVGVLQVVGDGLNIKYNLPSATDAAYESSVIVSDGTLEAHASINHQKDAGSWGWEEVSVTIPNYVEGTSTYTSSNNTFYYMVEGMEGWTQVQSQGELTVNVTKSGDTYTFKIAGADAQLKVPSLGIDWENPAAVKFSVEFSVKESAGQPE